MIDCVLYYFEFHGLLDLWVLFPLLICLLVLLVLLMIVLYVCFVWYLTSGLIFSMCVCNFCVYNYGFEFSLACCIVLDCYLVFVRLDFLCFGHFCGLWCFCWLLYLYFILIFKFGFDISIRFGLSLLLDCLT